MHCKNMKKHVGTLCALAICGSMLLTGCGTGKSSTAKNDESRYEATFDVSTSEKFDISIDKDSGYAMKVDKDSFTVYNTDKSAKTSVDVTGVFLDKTVMNQTQAEFHEDKSYKEITVDGQTGYSFEAKDKSKDDIKTYVHVIPCDGSDATYLELFSTISEKDLIAVEKTLHVETSR